MSEEKPAQKIDAVPDPEEDDLDDLDEVLDEFNKKPVETSAKPAASAAAPAASNAAPGVGLSAQDDEEFAKTLEASMQNLIGELDSNPDMQKEFEKMMQELIAAGSAATQQESSEHIAKATEAATASSSKAEKESFQDTIRKTMERMQASGDQASAAAASSSEEDFLAQMMKELSAGGGEEDFNKMLMSMMGQLTNKEILYEPMKELHDKFPDWLEKNKTTTKPEELTRYKEQQRLVGEIVGRFEQSGYSDNNDKDREFIVEKMQQMQSQGSPPPDLVGDMSAAQEALGELEGGCPTQ